MINVTTENFETEVIQASQSGFVLVDFWAEWCGPCKALGPLLEKLEADYGGRFKLVKIDSDAQQELSQAFGIRSLPTCILMKDGKPLDGFMGALPEGKLKEFLDKHIPSAQEALAEVEEEQAQEALAEGDTEGALAKLEQALANDPANDDARFDLVKLLLTLGRADDAKVAFAPVIGRTAQVRRFDSLQRWMDAIDFSAQHQDLTEFTLALDNRISANKRDFEARFGIVQVLMTAQQWTAAMDELLEILMRDKTWNEQLARKTYVAILDLIEPAKTKVADGQIPSEDPTVTSYRRRLSSVILS